MFHDHFYLSGSRDCAGREDRDQVGFHLLATPDTGQATPEECCIVCVRSEVCRGDGFRYLDTGRRLYRGGRRYCIKIAHHLVGQRDNANERVEAWTLTFLKVCALNQTG